MLAHCLRNNNLFRKIDTMNLDGLTSWKRAGWLHLCLLTQARQGPEILHRAFFKTGRALGAGLATLGHASKPDIQVK